MSISQSQFLENYQNLMQNQNQNQFSQFQQQQFLQQSPQLPQNNNVLNMILNNNNINCNNINSISTPLQSSNIPPSQPMFGMMQYMPSLGDSGMSHMFQNPGFQIPNISQQQQFNSLLQQNQNQEQQNQEKNSTVSSTKKAQKLKKKESIPKVSKQSKKASEKINLKNSDLAINDKENNNSAEKNNENSSNFIVQLEKKQKKIIEKKNENNNDFDEEDDEIENKTEEIEKTEEHLYLIKIIAQIVDNLGINEDRLLELRAEQAKSEFFRQEKNEEKQEELEQQQQGENEQMVHIFDTLVQKFRKLRKTKEEQIKFCMRKAFKFLFGFLKKQTDLKNFKEANELCMKNYFQEHIGDTQFVLPFRRNSQIKTMNSSFLKKIFSSQQFSKDYKQFLEQFDVLAEEDNSKKIDLLAQTVLESIQSDQIKKIETLRRLPWTGFLLKQTKALAFTLLEYSNNTSTQQQQFTQQQQEQPCSITTNDLQKNCSIATAKVNTSSDINLSRRESEDSDTVTNQYYNNNSNSDSNLKKRKRTIILIPPTSEEKTQNLEQQNNNSCNNNSKKICLEDNNNNFNINNINNNNTFQQQQFNPQILQQQQQLLFNNNNNQSNLLDNNNILLNQQNFGLNLFQQFIQQY